MKKQAFNPNIVEKKGILPQRGERDTLSQDGN